MLKPNPNHVALVDALHELFHVRTSCDASDELACFLVRRMIVQDRVTARLRGDAAPSAHAPPGGSS
jgi:hypothetical protein